MAGNNNSNNRGNNAAGARGTKKKKNKRKNRGNARSGGGSAPAAVGTGYIAQGPAVVRSVGPTVRFSNTEFVADVTAPTTGVTSPVIALSINPANAGLCPWLSRIAIGYELYRFRKLILRYTPTCGSGTFGMVVMAIDYDATDNAPSSKQALSAYEGATRGNVWSKSAMAAVPTAGWYYTGLSGGVSNPSNTDVKFYDMGKIYLGVYNQTASGTVGELSIEYDIEFAKPDYSIAAGLSEKLTPVGSTISLISGTGQTVAGNNILTIASSGSGQATLTAQVAGDYLLQIVGLFTVSASWSGSIFYNVQQTDPNSNTNTLTWDEIITSGTTVGASNGFNYTLLVTLQAGTTLLLSTISAVTALQIQKIRAANYRKALA